MPRKVRVTTTCMAGVRLPTVDENRKYVLGLLDLACAQKPDIVCLPEAFATAGVSLPLAQKAEPVPGPTTDACAKRARQHRTYIVCPLITKREGNIYNSAVLLDRHGQIAGIYDKVHPVTTTHDFTEVENGTTPGREAKVFELDFGRVGCQICFDLGFPETWKQLAENKAELVFWVSAFGGGFALQVYAYLHNYFVTSAVKTSYARIINPLGEVLEQTWPSLRVASYVIDLDYIICYADFHTNIPRELMRAHGPDVSIKVYDEEGVFLIQSNSADLPLSKLIEDFGLESSHRYHNRHREVYAALLAGQALEAQATPYRHRAQYG